MKQIMTEIDALDMKLIEVNEKNDQAAIEAATNDLNEARNRLKEKEQEQF